MAAGRLSLPGKPGMLQEIENHRAYQRKTYLDAPRYVLEVDYKTYTAQMKADMAAGVGGV